LHFTNAVYGVNIKSNKQETVEMEELNVGELKHLIYVKNVENCSFFVSIVKTLSDQKSATEVDQ
jgi:hypothetical protein